MKKLIVVLTIMLISTLCFAWPVSKDNPEKNIRSLASDRTQQSIKKSDVNVVNEELNREAGSYIGNYILADSNCVFFCKKELERCNRWCSNSICTDHCLDDFTDCVSRCSADGDG
jgi:hypothetical protein